MLLAGATSLSNPHAIPLPCGGGNAVALAFTSATPHSRDLSIDKLVPLRVLNRKSETARDVPRHIDIAFTRHQIGIRMISS
jgi:hypothetical protein